MNYLSGVSKINKYKEKKKKKVNLVKGFALLSLIGIVIGGVTKRLLAQSRIEEKNDIDVTEPKTDNEDINTKRNEIKHTLEEFGDEVVGDVGVAMEKALDGLELKKQKEE
ncbi:hypothetical protein [Clostridium sp.]|mgnify:FL=1|uniref:hypothetical protein n=1 Tax=Clostridium sp. TaxID=1506 RepID=UPI002604D12B|nr:hypothetical protein [uncultured Clostridium sp.]